METLAHFVVATPARTVCDDNARALERQGALRLLALGTRRGTAGVPPQRTSLNPWVGLWSYVAARTLPARHAEAFRFGLLPWFDRWARKQLRPGDHIISSYGYANTCFEWVRAHGGKTFVDAGNSHPEHYWNIVAEEHARWNCPLPPFPRNWFKLSLAMMPLVDYVLSPSSYVTRTFLERGFKPEQIIRNVYPTNLECFRPATHRRPKDRSLTLICTGAPSLRKGTPYVLEAFRRVRRVHPTARLLLTQPPHPSLPCVMEQFRDVPIEWGPTLPPPQLAERLRSADIFLLPSLEDGFARTVTEALACGLPAILTPNTGACDLIEPDCNGEIVPIRDAPALAEAVLKWAARILDSEWQPRPMVDPKKLSFDTFAGSFLEQLRQRKLLP